MKVVYNPKGEGLHLNAAEMRMFCKLRGWQLRSHPPVISSDTTWFAGSVGTEFRADPLLVRLVETGMCSNADLRVFEWDEHDARFTGNWTMFTIEGRNLVPLREWVCPELTREGQAIEDAYEYDDDY